MEESLDRGVSARSAIVTGSTSGIGLGIATALAQAGAAVTLNGFGDAQAIERTRAELAERTGVTVRHSGADMSKGDEVVAMVREAESAHGTLDILVNNAGIQFVAPIEEFPAAKWEAIPRSISRTPTTRSTPPCPGCAGAASAASSTSPRRTGWSPRRTRPPMSRPSTAWSA
jgi:hypothetical protein